MNINREIADKFGMSPLSTPTISLHDAWTVVDEITKQPDTQVLVRNCNSSRCGGIIDGIAERGDYFCNIIVGDEEGQRPTTYPTFAKTLPMAISLAVCKYLGIEID